LGKMTVARKGPTDGSPHDLLVAAGEQEDVRSFFAPQKVIGSPWALWLCQGAPNANLFGTRPRICGRSSRLAERDGLRAVFLPHTC